MAMAIRALPADSACLLGAASQLATPISVIKELVENALDAGATTVEVRVSPNTVDRIEVRDDGHGILPANFAALGRRGHTSKLARFEDLPHVVGGGSLGFRGEGLASANSLGYVAITTRSSGAATETAPPVASSFRLVRGVGGVSVGSLKPASAPVGTTVTVTRLFSSLPVRRKAAERETSKTLAAIKALLCGYALAHPGRLRLALRVFQQTAPVWQFCPRAVASGGGGTEIMREAVCVLFGPEAARQCQEVVLSLAGRPAVMGLQSASTLAAAPTPEFTYVFEGFLPKPGADLSKLAFGSFVSVDGRPLSARHGSIAAKLLTIFWTRLEKTVSLAPGRSAQQQHQKLRDVFVRLNIQCPVGSYDANVEASKTDVLFADEQAVCSAFEQFCSRVYGPGDRPLTTTIGRERQAVLSSSLGLYFPSPPSPAVRPGRGGGVVYSGQSGIRRQQQDSMMSYRQVAPARGLQTPPPSSPVESASQVRGDSRPGRGLFPHPGVVLQREYRQTPLSFRVGLAGPQQREAAGPDVSCPTTPTTQQQAQQKDDEQHGAPGSLDPAPAVAVQRFPRTTVVRHTAGREMSAHEERPNCVVMEISLAKLAKAADRLAARETVWGSDTDALEGVGDDDLAGLEKRTKDVIAKWLARETRAAGKGTVKVAFYLRQGLEKRASAGAA